MKFLSLKLLLFCIFILYPFVVSASELEMIQIKTSIGNDIDIAVVKPEAKGTFPAVIIQRGARGKLPQYENALARYAKEGFVAVAIDSNVSGRGIQAAADKIGEVVNYLKKLDYVKPDKIGIWGSSNGGAAAIKYVSDNPAPALVTFGAIYRAVASSIEKLSSPLIFLHGTDDETSDPNDAKLHFTELSKTNKNARLKMMQGKKHTWDSDVMTESIVFFKETLK